MEQTHKSRGGRPWSFDRAKAVDIAMRLFWRHGYEGVSINDLTEAIGIASPSLYAAFGSKAGLFREALARYEEISGSRELDHLASATNMEEAVRFLLETAVRAVTHPERERGCMISDGMIAAHPDHDALARHLTARRDAMRDAMDRALQPHAAPEEARRVARHLAAVMQGISIQARDGATEAELQEIVEDVVSGLVARRDAARLGHGRGPHDPL